MGRSIGTMALASVMAALASCAERVYAPPQVEVLSVQRDEAGWMTLEFQPLAETLFYCSDVLVRNRPGEGIDLRFVRTDFDVRTDCTNVERGEGTALRVRFPNEQENPVFITANGESDRRIWP